MSRLVVGPPVHARRARRLLAGFVLAVLAGCGTSPATPSAAGPASTPAPSALATAPAASATPALTTIPAATPLPSGAADGLELVEAGRLISCTDFPTPVMAEHNAEGKPIGVNVEIAAELARRLDLELEIRDIVFETLIDEVAAGRCDISISGQIITRTRLERIALIPYLQGVQHVVVREGNPTGITELLDLCGQSLAVQSGTTHVDLVLGEGDHADSGLNQQCLAAARDEVDLHQFGDAEAAVDALASGASDAYIGNDFVIIERPGLFELGPDLPPIRLGIGLGIGKVRLHDAIATAFAAMVADGAYSRILETYDALHLALTEAP